LVSVNPKALAAVLVLVLVLTATLPALPPVGDASAPILQETNEGGTTPYGYYVENAYDETGVENAVTAVLVFYRGFDTFGEAVVVFSAVVGALILFGGGMRRETE
jgi:multicomponent Na+:H+ antiporter subunit B